MLANMKPSEAMVGAQCPEQHYSRQDELGTIDLRMAKKGATYEECVPSAAADTASVLLSGRIAGAAAGPAATPGNGRYTMNLDIQSSSICSALLHLGSGGSPARL